MNLLSQVLMGNPAADAVIMVRDNGEPKKHSEFLNDVAHLSIELSARGETRWILYSSDLYRFAVAFFALLDSGKTIYLPPNAQKGTLQEMAEFSEALICDENDKDLSCPALQIKESERHVEYTFRELNLRDLVVAMYTSGSTGKPKLISKKLSQLEEELQTLQTQWGEKVKCAAYFSTVSHQHIYGLLFKLLWPLVSKNIIIAKIYQYPEELIQAIQKYNCAVLVSSPVHLDATIQIEQASQLKGVMAAIFSSAGPLSATTSLSMREKCNMAVTEVLGSTETGGVAYRSRTRTDSDDTWTTFPRVEIMANAEQVLMVKSPHLGSEEWFTMGDTAHVVSSDRFILKKRVDRIVKLGGKRLSLDELEQRLKTSVYIEDVNALVIEQPRQTLAIVAILSAEGIKKYSENNKIELVKELKIHLLAHYENVLLPKKWRFVKCFPRNSQGKIHYTEMIGLFNNE